MFRRYLDKIVTRSLSGGNLIERRSHGRRVGGAFPGNRKGFCSKLNWGGNDPPQIAHVLVVFDVTGSFFRMEVAVFKVILRT